MENLKKTRFDKENEFTGILLKRITFPHPGKQGIFAKEFAQKSFPLSTGLVDYRQELILAVMSRMWFFRFSSPACKACSTFLMECIMVV